MKEVLKATYREIHIPAVDFASFLQSIYGSGRVGTLTISIGPGGIPCGIMVWKERVSISADGACVESTEFISLRSPAPM